MDAVDALRWTCTGASCRSCSHHGVHLSVLDFTTFLGVGGLFRVRVFLVVGAPGPHDPAQGPATTGVALAFEKCMTASRAHAPTESASLTGAARLLRGTG